MDEQPLFASAAPPAAAPIAGVVHPHRFLDRPLLTPRYLPGAAYYGHVGYTIRWSLYVYARIVGLVRQLFPEELPLHTRFNPLDSGDMAEAIGWLHRLVNDRLFPIVDHSAETDYFFADDGDLPESLYWLTPSVLGVNYDIDYVASFYDDAQIGAFGPRGVVDFMMTLAADEIGDVNPYDNEHIPDTPFGIARYHYGAAPPDSFSLTNVLRGIGCITLPPSYEALPLLLRIVLKQTGNTFLDISADELWEATVDWDDTDAMHKLTQEYKQAQPWLAAIRQLDLFYQREPTIMRRTMLGTLVQAWQIGSGQPALLPAHV